MNPSSRPTKPPHRLGHRDKHLAAAAIVTATTADGRRWLLMVKLANGPWALPSGMIDPGEEPADAAERHLAAETGLQLPAHVRRELLQPHRFAPGARGCDKVAWQVTQPVLADLSDNGDRVADQAALPTVAAAGGVRQAAWLPADSHAELTAAARRRGGPLFAAHDRLLLDVLDWPGKWMIMNASRPQDRRRRVERELRGYTAEQLHAAAADGLLLRAAIEQTSADPWETNGPGVDVERLCTYLTHLADATRGVCDTCGQIIHAWQYDTDLPRRPWWHPRRWQTTAVDIAGVLRHGGMRTKHHGCATRP